MLEYGDNSYDFYDNVGSDGGWKASGGKDYTNTIKLEQIVEQGFEVFTWDQEGGKLKIMVSLQ